MMKYQIEVNDIIQAEAETKDMATFIARAISAHWQNLNDPRKVTVYKDGEYLGTF